MAVIEQEPLAEPFSVPVDPVRQVFWDAADLIEEKGWIQCAGRNPDGICMVEAILQVINREMSLFMEVQEVLYPMATVDFVIWNDYPGRTKKEVVARLREIADSQ